MRINCKANKSTKVEGVQSLNQTSGRKALTFAESLVSRAWAANYLSFQALSGLFPGGLNDRFVAVVPLWQLPYC
jgi:hypothetical protein